MPVMRITQREVATIGSPDKGQILWWDDKLKGFGLRVTPTAKTFICQGRVKGKDCRVTIGRADVLTPEQARNLALKHLADMAKGIDPNKLKSAERSRAITLKQVFDDYIEKKDLREKTLKVYKSALNRCFSDWCNKHISQITRDMVEDRFNRIGTANGPRGEGKAQAAQAMRLLGSLFNYAMNTYEDEEGKLLITENPVRRLAHIKRGWSRVGSRQSLIQAGELASFYEGVRHLKNDTAKDFLMLLILTGLRRTEAVALTWEEVDLKNQYLLLPPARTKNKQPHGLPLTPYLVSMLSRRQAASNSKYVFPGTKNPQGHYKEPKSAIRSVSSKMEKGFMAHDCRRTFITVAEKLGIPHYALKKLLNHAGGDITGLYVQVDIDRLREPMQLITDYMLEQMQVPAEDLQ